MRLSALQVKVIRSSVMEVLGEGCVIKLFGSRVHDAGKGGDIDILIQTEEPVERPAKALAQIEAKMIMQLGDRKIDLLLDAPNLERSPILAIAHQTGIPL